MFRRLRSIWKPEVYHGRPGREPYFEGWYFKSVAPGGKGVVAVIPGISLTGDASTSHAFIQVLDGVERRSDYYRFDVSEFSASPARFDLRVGRSRFTLEGIDLDASGTGRSVRGSLRFRGIRPWPVTFFSPGAMGWYAFAPSMECYHGVLSFGHETEGRLSLNGREFDFSGGRGYIEKDWGTSMPRAWVWMQTNDFGGQDASLSLSLATIPWRKHWFSGLLIGFRLAERLFRFTTYTGAKLRGLAVDDETVEIAVADRKHELRVKARRAAGASLASPVSGAMEGRLSETLSAVADVELGRRDGRTFSPVFQGTGLFAGLEVVGDIDELRSGF